MFEGMGPGIAMGMGAGIGTGTGNGMGIGMGTRGSSSNRATTVSSEWDGEGASQQGWRYGADYF
jgi:hypothetical protein